jgi:hypothetical protein
MEHFVLAVLALVSSILNSLLLLAVVQRLDCPCPWCANDWGRPPREPPPVGLSTP